MLSNREKEIIRNVYIIFSEQVYSSSGPNFLSSEDYKEISSFLNTLKRKDSLTCIHIPEKPIDCEKCKQKNCYNCKHRVYDMFDGDTYCQKRQECKNYSKWEEKVE